EGDGAADAPRGAGHERDGRVAHPSARLLRTAEPAARRRSQITVCGVVEPAAPTGEQPPPPPPPFLTTKTAGPVAVPSVLVMRIVYVAGVSPPGTVTTTSERVVDRMTSGT